MSHILENESAPEKKWLAVHVTPEFVAELVRGNPTFIEPNGYRLTLSSSPQVPSDAKVHHAFYSAERGTFVVVMEHSDFEPVSEGSWIPSAYVLVSVTHEETSST